MFNKDIAKANDARLLKMASYVESNGTTRRIKSMDLVFKKFAELKRLVRSGDFPSLDDLEDSVYKMYGIIDNDLDSSDESAMIKQMIKMADEDIAKNEKEQEKSDGVDKKHS
jgi:hypothetical protein